MGGATSREAAPYETPYRPHQFLWKNSSDSIRHAGPLNIEAQAGLLCLSNPYKTNGGNLWRLLLATARTALP